MENINTIKYSTNVSWICTDILSECYIEIHAKIIKCFAFPMNFSFVSYMHLFSTPTYVFPQKIRLKKGTCKNLVFSELYLFKCNGLKLF